MQHLNSRLKLATCAMAALLAACSGGDATAPGSTTTASSGYVVDGYLKDATVVCDTNGNGMADTGEVSVKTDSSGFFRFSPSCTSAMISSGGISTDTNVTFTGKLKAAAGATVITPLTTLLASGISQSKLIEVLGLPPATELLTTDPAFKPTGSSNLINADLMKKTLVMQQVAQKITESIAGLASGTADKAAIYSEVMTALAQALAANPALISGNTANETVTAALVKAAAQRVAASSALPTNVKAGISTLNSDSLAQVMAGGLKIQADTILGASSADLTATTTSAQNSTVISAFIQANKASLTGAPSTATASLTSTLRAQLTQAAPPPPPPPATNNLIANGNFSNGVTGWSGNAANVQTEGGNSFNLANVASAGKPYDVNLSYVLNIPNSGVAYKLRFKASSNRARTMVAGIGLNQDPWTNVSQTVNLTTTHQTFELSLTSNFASPTSRVLFDMGADTGTVVIDDVELVLDTTTTPAPAPAGGPTVAAPAPTASAANVKSIFSDAYTNVAVSGWGPDWGPASARITDGVIAGNNYKTIDMSAAGKEFAGISFVGSKFDATPYTTFNMDYWIDAPLLAGQVLNIKLSNHDGSGETSAIQSTITNITAGSWQRLSIPLSSFVVAGGGSTSRNNIAEIIITAARANTAQPVKVYFDNMYFSK